MTNDVVSSALQAMRVSGTLLMRAAYRRPWAIDLPDSAGLAALFGLPTNVHVVAFHLVEHGELAILDSRGQRHDVGCGEMAILFGGGVHRLSSGQANTVMSVEQVFASAESPFGAVGEGDEHTKLVCGAFLLRNTQLNPLFAALPPIATMRVAAPGDDTGWLGAIAGKLCEEVGQPSAGSGFVIERLVELLCAEVVRGSVQSAAAPAPSWFNALRDPALARALTRIHADPAQAWTVDTMASCATLSRSRFAARFVQTLGESPMQYLTRWRMNLATRLLSSARHSVEQVATQVGYSSVPAFSRAFRQQLGLSPMAYRTQQRAAE